MSYQEWDQSTSAPVGQCIFTCLVRSKGRAMNGFRGPELQPVHRAAWSERSRSTMWPASSYVQRVCTNLRVVNIAIAPGTAVHCTVWLLQLLLPKVCRGRFEVPEQSSCAPLNDSCKPSLPGAMCFWPWVMMPDRTGNRLQLELSSAIDLHKAWMGMSKQLHSLLHLRPQHPTSRLPEEHHAAGANPNISHACIV